MRKYFFSFLFLGLVSTSLAQTPFRIAGFYSPEALYTRQFEPVDIPADELTHLFYAFVIPKDINGDGYYEAVWANTDIVQHAFFSRSLIPRDTSRIDRRGVLRQLVHLKRKHPHLRILLSLGGTCSYDQVTGSCNALHERFVQISQNPAHREVFINTLIQLFTNPMGDGSVLGLFDGLDVDWEFPGAGEKATFVLFMQTLRDKLDEIGSKRKERYVLTFDGPATSYFLQHYDVPALAKIVDWVNVMAYLYHMPQPWNPHTGHLAPFAGNIADGHGSGYNVQEMSVAAWIKAGMPPEKISLGLPYFGVGYTGVKAGKKDLLPGLFQTYHGPLVPSGEVPYADLWSETPSYREASLYWDESAKAAFLYNRSKKIWISLETPQSLFIKTQWAKQKGLSGVFVWELSQEAMGGSGQAPLTRSIGLAARSAASAIPEQGILVEACTPHLPIRCTFQLTLHRAEVVEITLKGNTEAIQLQKQKRLSPGLYQYHHTGTWQALDGYHVEVTIGMQKQVFTVRPGVFNRL